MISAFNVGTILIEVQPPVLQVLEIESEPWTENWRIIKGLDSFAFSRKVNAAGWNSFFIGGGMKAMFLGTPKAEKIQHAITRILSRVKDQHFNGLEITDIVSKHCFGVSYVTVSAHSRHIQQSCFLGNACDRTSQLA